MEYLNLPFVLGALQLIAGYVLKRWPKFPNQVIPVATYVLALLGYTVAPAEANAASTLGSVIGSGASLFLTALAQNLMVTGIHSTWKNAVFPAFRWTFGALLSGRK